MHYIYIDEAGRGPIAGPVYVGLIIEHVDNMPSLERLSEASLFAKKGKRPQKIPIFPARDRTFYSAYADSKVLSESERNHLYITIVQNPLMHYATAKATAKEIDKHGIVRALRQGILRALHASFVGGIYTLKSLQAWLASQQHNVILVIDGPSDFGLRNALGVTVLPVIDGDALIPMVSAASILAKVERDAYMTRSAKKLPQYGFEKHKGYGTKAHYESVAYNGLSSEHRSTFIHNT